MHLCTVPHSVCHVLYLIIFMREHRVYYLNVNDLFETGWLDNAGSFDKLIPLLSKGKGAQ